MSVHYHGISKGSARLRCFLNISCAVISANCGDGAVEALFPENICLFLLALIISFERGMVASQNKRCCLLFYIYMEKIAFTSSRMDDIVSITVVLTWRMLQYMPCMRLYICLCLTIDLFRMFACCNRLWFKGTRAT